MLGIYLRVTRIGSGYTYVDLYRFSSRTAANLTRQQAAAGRLKQSLTPSVHNILVICVTQHLCSPSHPHAPPKQFLSAGDGSREGTK